MRCPQRVEQSRRCFAVVLRIGCDPGDDRPVPPTARVLVDRPVRHSHENTPTSVSPDIRLPPGSPRQRAPLDAGWLLGDRTPNGGLSLNPPVEILWLGVDRRGKCL